MSRYDPKQRRVALYARTATDIRSPNSVETQLSMCRFYAQRQGWRVETELFDREIDGPNDERPGFQSLCRVVESRAVDIVLFVSLDRLSRDLGLVRLFQQTASRLKVELHQIDLGRVQLLDIAILSSTVFKRLAAQREARITELAKGQEGDPLN